MGNGSGGGRRGVCSSAAQHQYAVIQQGLEMITINVVLVPGLPWCPMLVFVMEMMIHHHPGLMRKYVHIKGRAVYRITSDFPVYR